MFGSHSQEILQTMQAWKADVKTSMMISLESKYFGEQIKVK